MNQHDCGFRYFRLLLDQYSENGSDEDEKDVAQKPTAHGPRTQAYQAE